MKRIVGSFKTVFVEEQMEWQTEEHVNWFTKSCTGTGELIDHIWQLKSSLIILFWFIEIGLRRKKNFATPMFRRTHQQSDLPDYSVNA